VAELVQEFFRPHFNILLSVIDELVPSDVSQERRHMLAFSIIGQCLHYRVAQPIVNLLVGPEESATLTPDHIAQHIAEFSLAALRNWTAEIKATKRTSKPVATHGARP
jgi:hypothetical protein